MYIRIDNKYKFVLATKGKYLVKDRLYAPWVYVPIEEDLSSWREADCAPEDEILDSNEVFNRLNNIIDSI